MPTTITLIPQVLAVALDAFTAPGGELESGERYDDQREREREREGNLLPPHR
jgi:ADP-ribose pyrophosphatase YjhB (NUDIX family)